LDATIDFVIHHEVDVTTGEVERTQKVREGGRVVNVAVVVATGVNNEGLRESLGFDVITTEDGAGWTAFLRNLVARGLSGVALVVSDDHKGLKAAIAAVLPGAVWQGAVSISVGTS
jgi:putative transposase